MKNNTNFIIAAVIGLLAIAILILNQRNTRISQIQQKIFDIDSSEISSITIDENQSSITLIQRDDGWETDMGITVKPEAVHSFFEAQKRIQIKAPASRKVRDNILKQINLHGLRVELERTKGKNIEYHLVYDQHENTGTYLMLPDRKTPYQIFLPGFSRKELISLYPTNPEFWREKNVFELNPNQIASITLEYNEAIDQSFKLQKKDMNFVLLDLNENKVTDLNQKTGWTYFQSFSTLPYQHTIDTSKVSAKMLPYASLEIDLNPNRGYRYQLFNVIDETGKLLRDIVWIKPVNRNDIFEVKFVDIALLLNSRQDFLQ